MRNAYYKTGFILILMVALPRLIAAQKNATIQEYKKSYTTYPFSDPDPIPDRGEIYPYFRFDGFTDEPVQKEWKVIELENDYIKVQIMPEIGGKIWTAKEKSGEHFLYNNEVVKFRDIAMRGPWVSGGIEANYGIIGHTPNSATPVDYMVKKNDDGSVSCFTSTLDLLTRTRWVLEIKLRKDKAYFTTKSFWFNSTGMEQPYYTWMNAAIPSGDDLQLLFPGSNYIGHDGLAKKWPIDDFGNDLSHYSENDFGGSKSYHVLGSHSDYFGALWEDENFGMVHYSKREEKLGRKIWLWAQSRQGEIWKDLLTDNNGQYVEIQSGRLFNQSNVESSFTPFKQIGFAPYNSDNWTEYWYPFKNIKGFTDANLIGAFNIKVSEKELSIKISPVQFINDTLRVYNKDGQKLLAAFVKAEPLEAVEIEFDFSKKRKLSYFTLKGERVAFFDDKSEKSLSRPLEIPDNFETESSYGLYLQGRDLARFRNYQLAEEKIRASLAQNSLFLPSLVEMAKLKLSRMQYDSAFYFSKKALSIDTYNGEANYYYGLSASKLDRHYDALDGFEVASLSPQFRNAAYTRLSHLYVLHNNLNEAKEYAHLALRSNQDNIDALQVLYLIGRIKKDKNLLQENQEKIKALNPLNHFMRFEIYYQTPSDENKENFIALIRNEMPIETFLELAIWYAKMDRFEESEKVLKLAPQNAISLYWLAWLNRKGNPRQSNHFLAEAEQSSPAFVFPFREETAVVLKWASREKTSWKVDYLLALIHDFRGNRKTALSLVDKYENNIEFAPFYILKARLDEEASLQTKRRYIENAVRLEPGQWRYGKELANILMQLQKNKEAIQVLEEYYKADKTNYIIGLDLVKAFINEDRYQEAESVLQVLRALPFEGATTGRKFYRETKLMLAYRAMKEDKYAKALEKVKEAEMWPERLGVGKPYPDQIDNDLEIAMKAIIYKKMNDMKLYQEHIKQVKDKSILKGSLYEKIEVISLKADERNF